MLTCSLRAQDKDLKIELKNKCCIEKITLMASFSKIKVMTHDVTQVFNGMHKEITSIQPKLISWQRGHPD